MEQLKKMICGGFIGVGIGHLLNLWFSYIYGEYVPGVPSFLKQYDSILTAVTIQTIIYMLLGIIQASANTIMKNEKRSLLLNTVLHFVVIILPLLAAGYYLHWQRGLTGILSIGLINTIIYCGIWLANYFYIKSQIKKINQKIKYRTKS
ncbi:DUF3021 domain-containing protein [Facklamia sp. P12937]|uniref:DUF3021 domain-containing protein n=1 Tax=unclassified Facklamia TaxID=2622293 RepID=UPI003D164EAB